MRGEEREGSRNSETVSTPTAFTQVPRTSWDITAAHPGHPAETTACPGGSADVLRRNNHSPGSRGGLSPAESPQTAPVLRGGSAHRPTAPTPRRPAGCGRGRGREEPGQQGSGWLRPLSVSRGPAPPAGCPSGHRARGGGDSGVDRGARGGTGAAEEPPTAPSEGVP